MPIFLPRFPQLRTAPHTLTSVHGNRHNAELRFNPRRCRCALLRTLSTANQGLSWEFIDQQMFWLARQNRIRTMLTSIKPNGLLWHRILLVLCYWMAIELPLIFINSLRARHFFLPCNGDRKYDVSSTLRTLRLAKESMEACRNTSIEQLSIKVSLLDICRF